MKKLLFTLLALLIPFTASAQYGPLFSSYGPTPVPAGPRWFFEQAADPGAIADRGALYSKDIATITELFYIDSAGNVIQITSGGGIMGGYWDRVGTLVYPTTTGDDVAIADTNANSNSPYFYLRGDQAGAVIEGSLRLFRGTDPYLEVVVDDDLATPTPVDVLHIHDTEFIFQDTYKIGIVDLGAVTDNGGYLSLEAGDAGTLAGGGYGGSIQMTAGDAKGAGDNDGGNIFLNTGDETGIGAPGAIVFETSSDQWLTFLFELDGAVLRTIDNSAGDGADIRFESGDSTGGGGDGGSFEYLFGDLNGGGDMGVVLYETSAQEFLYIEPDAVATDSVTIGTGDVTNDDGINLRLMSGDADTTGAGGLLTLRAGDAAGAGDDGGSISLDAGQAAGAGAAGTISLQLNGGEYGYFLFNGSGPDLGLFSAAGAPAGADGFGLTFVGGDGTDPAATDRDGGDVSIYSGLKANAGNDGNIVFGFGGIGGGTYNALTFYGRGTGQMDMISMIPDQAGLIPIRIGPGHQWAAAGEDDRLVSFQLNLPTGNEQGWISKTGNLNFSDLYLHGENIYGGSYTSGSAADFQIENRQIISAGNYAGFDVKILASDAKNDGGAGGIGGNVELFAGDASAGGAQNNNGGLIVLDAGASTGGTGVPGYVRITREAGTVFGVDIMPLGTDGVRYVSNPVSGGGNVGHRLLTYSDLTAGYLVSIGDNFAGGAYDNKFDIYFDGATEITQDATATATPNEGIKFTGGSHTNMPAGVSYNEIFFDLEQTKQFATGAITNIAAFEVAAPDYSFVGASTIAVATTMLINGAPTEGTNATITDGYSLASVSSSAGNPSTIFSYTFESATSENVGISAYMEADNGRDGIVSVGVKSQLKGDAGDVNDAEYIAFEAASFDDQGGTNYGIGLSVGGGYEDAIGTESGNVGFFGYAPTIYVDTDEVQGAGFDLTLIAGDGYDAGAVARDGGNIVLTPGEPDNAGRVGWTVLEKRVIQKGGSQTITGVGDTISPEDVQWEIGGDAGGPYTLTSTPTILAGEDNEILVLIGTNDTDAITLQDESNLAGSNLHLDGGVDFTLGLNDVLMLTYNTRTADWIEVSRSDNY